MTRIFYVIILALLTAGEARSQSAELGLTVGVSAFNDNGIGSLRVFEEGLIPVSLRNSVRIGARWATNSWGFLGHEFSYAFQRTSLKIGGGGLKFKLSYKFGLRFDVRDHVTGRPFDLDDSSGRSHNVEYSATFSLLF